MRVIFLLILSVTMTLPLTACSSLFDAFFKDDLRRNVESEIQGHLSSGASCVSLRMQCDEQSYDEWYTQSGERMCVCQYGGLGR